MKKLENKVALVTGGNSGIGLATAKLFKDQGAQVVITARSAETYEKAKTEYGDVFKVIQADVTELRDIDNLYQQIKEDHKGIDILFANAGVAAFQPTAEFTPEAYDRIFDTNVKGLFFSVSKGLPFMNKGASVVLTGSIAAHKGFPGGAVYGATKAAIRSMARAWSAEIPVGDVRFNVLSPGPIETPIYAKLGMPADQLEAFSTDIQSRVPAGRFGSSEEMAKVALFLASSDSSYLRGAEIMADGGFAQI